MYRVQAANGISVTAFAVVPDRSRAHGHQSLIPVSRHKGLVIAPAGTDPHLTGQHDEEIDLHQDQQQNHEEKRDIKPVSGTGRHDQEQDADPEHPRGDHQLRRAEPEGRTVPEQELLEPDIFAPCQIGRKGSIPAWFQRGRLCICRIHIMPLSSRRRASPAAAGILPPRAAAWESGCAPPGRRQC